MKPRIGDYVTGSLHLEEGSRQGVYVRNNRDGTVVIKGELDTYLCNGPDGLTIVPDDNINPGKEFVLEVRESLGLH